VETLAEQVRERAPRLVAQLGPDRTVLRPVDAERVEPLLAHLHATLFDEEGYRGNTEDYYHPYNSYLPAVMETRHGLPITLTLLYKAVAERLGLRVEGINAPGHFMGAVRRDARDEGAGVLLVDAFDGGRMLSRDEALERVEAITGAAVNDGEGRCWSCAGCCWRMGEEEKTHRGGAEDAEEAYQTQSTPRAQRREKRRERGRWPSLRSDQGAPEMIGVRLMRSAGLRPRLFV